MTALVDAPTADVSALKPINTKREIAEFIGSSVDYIDVLISQGKLGFYKRGRSKQASVRIGRGHVVALLRSWER